MVESRRKITVVEKLTELRRTARTENWLMVREPEIYFYKLTGCWGNPPRHYQEILKRQEAELAYEGSSTRLLR